MRVIHIIIGLETGGAERMLARLANYQNASPRQTHAVISLTTIGPIGRELIDAGVPVRSLGMRSLFDLPRTVVRLVRLLRAAKPDIVQTWMYHADLLGGVAARLAGGSRIVWGVRGSAIPQSGLSVTAMIVRLSASLSGVVPHRIVCCAERARIAHIEKGYSARRCVVIPNGYHVPSENRSSFLRQGAREEVGFKDGEFVIGVVGRFDPLKDYQNFVRAAAMVASRYRAARFLMVGRGLDYTNRTLTRWIADSGFADRFVLIGEWRDVTPWLAASDAFCLSSLKEGFPNAVCEAMAMQVPCLVTDAGDAAEIVGDTGIVVPPADSEALARGMVTLMRMPVAERTRRGALARLRIAERYSIEAVATRFGALYSELAAGRGYDAADFSFGE